MDKRVLFYDNVDTGHHPGYVDGIVREAQAEGWSLLVATPTRPQSLADNEAWLRVDSPPLRSVIANRTVLSNATRWASDRFATTLVDLFLDKQIWAIGGNRLPQAVHVLHHAEQYAPREGTAGLRTKYLRLRLARQLRGGSVIVVHTARTLAILDGVAPPEQAVLLGYPVEPLPPNRGSGSDRPQLLFVGAGRREKGLDLLLPALRRLDADLRVVGRQAPGLIEALTASYPDVVVTWVEGFTSRETLHEEYRRADIAVLPYRSEFGRHGGPSSVLLETLSAGLPIVTTTALADQLPAGYTGAVIAESDSVESLEWALRLAIDSLGDLIRGARRGGPVYVGEKHSFRSYVRGLGTAIDRLG